MKSHKTARKPITLALALAVLLAAGLPAAPASAESATCPPGSYWTSGQPLGLSFGTGSQAPNQATNYYCQPPARPVSGSAGLPGFLLFPAPQPSCLQSVWSGSSVYYAPAGFCWVGVEFGYPRLR